MRPRVLLVEDSTSLAILYKQYVKDEPYDIFHVETGREAIQFIERSKPQLIILDLKLPDMSGEDVLDWINENEIPTSVIIATAHGSVDLAVNLIQKGAEDFLEKPINADRLKTSVALHLKRAKLENLVENIQSTFDRHNYHGFIGSSFQCRRFTKPLMQLPRPQLACLSLVKVERVKKCVPKRFTDKVIAETSHSLQLTAALSLVI